jgi:cell division transport system permease protein
LASAPGVADVRYDRDWLARVTAGLAAVRGVGFALALVMVVAAALTVATVVRLTLHARRDEIEIMRLVGSPYAFIRGPFIAEGLLQGGIGALVALGVLWLGFAAAGAWWGGPLTEVVPMGTFRFLPVHLCAWLVAGGMFVGCLGGLAATRTT